MEKINWHCGYCGTENQTNLGQNYCEKCKRGHQILPDGKVVELFEKKSSGSRNTPEQTLSVIATITLWIGILGCVIISIAALAEENPLLLLANLIFLPLLMFWAFVKVFVNISMSLKEINQKMKNE